MTLQQIFAALGGPATIGRAIGKTTEHASAMLRRRSVPVRYWPALLDLAKTRGFPLNEADFVSAHTSKVA